MGDIAECEGLERYGLGECGGHLLPVRHQVRVPSRVVWEEQKGEWERKEEGRMRGRTWVWLYSVLNRYEDAIDARRAGIRMDTFD